MKLTIEITPKFAANLATLGLEPEAYAQKLVDAEAPNVEALALRHADELLLAAVKADPALKATVEDVIAAKVAPGQGKKVVG